MLLYPLITPQNLNRVELKGKFFLVPEDMTRPVTRLTKEFRMVHLFIREHLASPLIGMHCSRNQVMFRKRCGKSPTKTASPLLLNVPHSYSSHGF
jgi:hypothetical protein